MDILVLFLILEEMLSAFYCMMLAVSLLYVAFIILRYVPSMLTFWRVFIKMTILPKAVYSFNAIPIKLPMAFFTELRQKKLYGNTKRTTNSQLIL